MASVQSTPFALPRGKSVAILAASVLVTGAGGMAVSFLFLASRNPMDVIAGAVGFVAGAILVATGLLSLAVRSRSPSVGESAVRVTACLAAILPPLIAILALPVLYIGFFLGGFLLIPLVLIGCVVASGPVSKSVAGHLSALTGWPHVKALRWIVYAFQVIATLATLPLFGYLLDVLSSMGYKVGWS